MIQLVGNIKVYDNGGDFVDAKIINSPPPSSSLLLPTENVELDLSGVLDKGNNGNYINLSNGLIRGEVYFNNYFPNTISNYEKGEAVWINRQYRQVVRTTPIINITSKNTFNNFIIGTNMDVKKYCVLGDLQTITQFLKFTDTNIRSDGRHIYFAELVQNPNIIIESVVLITEIANTYVSALNLKYGAYIFLYSTSSGLQNTNIRVKINFRQITEEIKIDRNPSVVNLSQETNNLFLAIKEIDAIPYSEYNRFAIKNIDGEKEITINLNNCKEISSEISDREDYKLPQYGLISNASSLQFFDAQNNVEQLYELGLLEKNLTFEEYLENTLTKKKEKVATYRTTQWEYSNLDRICRVSFDDGLTKLQDIQVPSINYDARYPQSQTAYWFLRYIADYVPFNIIYNEETKSVLQNTIVPYPYLNSDNAWNSINKICTLCQLHAFGDEKQNLVLNYNGGN